MKQGPAPVAVTTAGVAFLAVASAAGIAGQTAFVCSMRGLCGAGAGAVLAIVVRRLCQAALLATAGGRQAQMQEQVKQEDLTEDDNHASQSQANG